MSVRLKALVSLLVFVPWVLIECVWDRRDEVRRDFCFLCRALWTGKVR